MQWSFPPAGGKARVELLVVSKEQAASLGIEPGPLTHEPDAERFWPLRLNRITPTNCAMFPRLMRRQIDWSVLWNVFGSRGQNASCWSKGNWKRCIVIPDASLAAVFRLIRWSSSLAKKPKYLLDVGPPIITPSRQNVAHESFRTGDRRWAPPPPPKSLKGNTLLSVADPHYGVPSTAPPVPRQLADLSARSRLRRRLRGKFDAASLIQAGSAVGVTEAFRKAGLDAGVFSKAKRSRGFGTQVRAGPRHSALCLS